MGKLRACLLFCIAALISGVASNALGQAAPTGPNADIVKMLQAGLPESTILNKIREGAGRWDTSVDALILLKQAGATEAEFAELTAAQAPAVQADSGAATEAPVEVAGAFLFRTGAGDPYLHFFSSKSEVFPDGVESNSAYLVIYKGEVGVLIAGSSLTLECHPLNAIFMKDRVVFDRYLDSGCMYRATLASKYRGPNPGPEEFAKEGLSLKVSKKYGMLDGGGTGFKAPFTMVQFSVGKKVVMKDRVAFGIFPYNGANTYEFTNTDLMYAPLLDPFIEGLMSNFDQTVLDVERAAKITDPLTQLSAQAHYEPITVARASKYMAILQQRHEESAASSSGSGGWLAALSALQGVANLQQAMAQAKAADLSRSGLAQTSSANPQKQQSSFTYNISHGQAENKTVAASTVVGTPSTTQVKTTPKPTTGPISVSMGTTAPAGTKNTAAPANCVAPNVEGPCIPLSQYHPTQGQQQASSQGICPASGFVPGVMIRKESDVAVGVPCKPGTPYGPLIATTSTGGYTGVTPPDPASAGGSGGSNASGTGGSGAGGGTVMGLACVKIDYKTDPVTGTHLILQNNCSVAAQAYFYSSAQVNGAAAINPGATENTYAAQDQIVAAGGVSVYACPVGYIPRMTDGTLAYNGRNNAYSCSPK